MANTETTVNQLKINRLTKTQFEGASGLNQNEIYFEDPEFAGGKLLQTLADGDIAESDEVPTKVQVLEATDSITLADGVIYNGGEQTSLTIAVPVSANVGFLCEILFTSGSTATVIPTNSIKWNGDDVISNIFIPVSGKRYTAFVWYDGTQFVGNVRGIA